jgi:hypothetical protein
MRAAGDDPHGCRLRGLIVILRRAGLHPGIGRARRGRSRSPPRRLAGPSRQGRPAPRGRMDSWVGRSSSPGSSCDSGFPSGRCCASSTVQHAGGSGRAPPREPICAGLRSRRAFAGALRRTSSGTLTPSSSLARGAAGRHPAPARPQQPRHHLRLPPGHRQRRDHRHRPCPPRADDPGQRIATALMRAWRGATRRAKRQRWLARGAQRRPHVVGGSGGRAPMPVPSD